MATLYWGGGTGTWDSTSVTHWYTDAGRTVLASAPPTYADDVIFDSGSNTVDYTVTIATGFVGTGSITGTVLTITAVTSGTLTVGSSIYTANLPGGTTYVLGGTYITSLGTGTGGIGTYNISQSQTVTSTSIAASASCNNLTINTSTNGALTVAGVTPASLSVYGNATIALTNIGWSGSSTYYTVFCSSTAGKTITNNNSIVGPISFCGTGSWTLGSAFGCSFNSTSGFRIIRGSFNTGNFNLTLSLSTFYSVGTYTRSISLGSSTVALTNASACINLESTGLTFNAGTSTFTITQPDCTFYGAGFTFGTVNFTNGSSGINSIVGANTFATLYFVGSPSASTGIKTVILSDNQIVTGTLTLGTTNKPNNRMFIASDTIGTPRTLTVNTTVAALIDVDVRDITAAGPLIPWTGTRLGNCGGNSNITFPLPKTVYWSTAAGGNWGTTNAWATSSGGLASGDNFPLSQDTVIINDTNLSAATSIVMSAKWNIGNINAATRTTVTNIDNNTVTPTIYGNVNLPAVVGTTGTGALTFSGSGQQYITSGGRTWTQPFVVNTQLSGGFSLGSALTADNTFTITRGNVTLNGFDLTVRTFNASNSNTKGIAFGNNNITVTGTGTVWSTTTSGGTTITGTNPTVVVSSTGSTAITVGSGTLYDSNAISFKFTGGTYALSLLTGTNNAARDLDFTGFSGTWNAYGTGPRIYGNLIMSPTMTLTPTTNVLSMYGANGNKTITTNGKTIDFPITFTGVGSEWVLQDNLTVGSTRTVTLTGGNINLNDQQLTANAFSSSGSTVRGINAGTARSGSIILNGSNVTVWDASNATNLSLTGNPAAILNNPSAVGTRTIIHGVTGGTETTAMSFNVVSGTDTVKFGTGSAIVTKNLDFIGFDGTIIQANQVTVYGNITIPPEVTYNAGANPLVFGSTSGVKYITTSGVQLNRTVTFDGVGGTWKLLDNTTTASATYNLNLVNGTLDLNGTTLTVPVSFATNNSNVRSLIFNNGTLICGGAITSGFSATSSTNLTVQGPGTIKFTNTSATTFNGGNGVYPIVLELAGTGDLTIAGSNTIDTITNSTAPVTLILPNNSTTTLNNFDLSGNPGQLVTLKTDTTDFSAVLTKSSGTVMANYVSIKDSFVTGGAEWYAGGGSINAGGNTGWQFIPGTAVIDIGKGITIGSGIKFT